MAFNKSKKKNKSKKSRECVYISKINARQEMRGGAGRLSWAAPHARAGPDGLDMVCESRARKILLPREEESRRCVSLSVFSFSQEEEEEEEASGERERCKFTQSGLCIKGAQERSGIARKRKIAPFSR